MSLRRGDDNTYYYGTDFTDPDDGDIRFSDVTFSRSEALDEADETTAFDITLRGFCLAHAYLSWNGEAERWEAWGVTKRPGECLEFKSKDTAMEMVADHLLGHAAIGVVPD